MTDAETKSLEDGFSTDNLWIPCPELVQGQHYPQDKNQNTRACKQQWPTNIDDLSTQKLVTACCIRKLEVLLPQDGTHWYTLYRYTMAAPKENEKHIGLSANIWKWQDMKDSNRMTKYTHPPSTSIKHHHPWFQICDFIPKKSHPCGFMEWKCM